MSTKTRTAHSALAFHVETIIGALGVLQERFDRLVEEGTGEKVDWGHVGTAARIADLLQEAAATASQLNV